MDTNRNPADNYKPTEQQVADFCLVLSLTMKGMDDIHSRGEGRAMRSNDTLMAQRVLSVYENAGVFAVARHLATCVFTDLEGDELVNEFAIGLTAVIGHFADQL